MLPWLIDDSMGLSCSSQTFFVQKSPQAPGTYLNSHFFSQASIFAAYFPLQQQTPDTKENPVSWIFFLNTKSPSTPCAQKEQINSQSFVEDTKAPPAGSSHWQFKGPHDRQQRKCLLGKAYGVHLKWVSTILVTKVEHFNIK